MCPFSNRKARYNALLKKVLYSSRRRDKIAVKKVLIHQEGAAGLLLKRSLLYHEINNGPQTDHTQSATVTTADATTTG